MKKATAFSFSLCLILSFLNPCLQGQSASLSDSKLGFHTEEAKGEKNFVLIFADFPDVKRQFSDSQMESRIMGFLPNYFHEASYGKLNMKIRATRHYVLPHPVSYYKISAANLNVDPRRVAALVTDVANAADADVEFSKDLYVIISLGATMPVYGMVGYCAVPGMLGWQEGSMLKNRSGEVISKAAVFCENAHMGTYIHDTLHMLGGAINGVRLTPCLYDHDLQAKYTAPETFYKAMINMGYWDPLSSHVPYRRELPPNGLSSWTKLRLGWIDETKIAVVRPGETATVTLDPLTNAQGAVHVIKIPISPGIYYLIENRQAISSDRNLPAQGVLVLYADDNVHECRGGKAPVRIMAADPDIPTLNGAAFDIGTKSSFVDKKNKVAVVLREKIGNSYTVLIMPPDKAEGK
jgi:M6 family metalloprotease-like protein